MIFISAGHHFNAAGADPGAIATYDGILYKEADLTLELRDLIAKELDILNASYITDRDHETLTQYLARIKPGAGSLVCDLHFNASANLATGTEVIVKQHANSNERKLATALCNAVAAEARIVNRGVKTEAQSHRGRLAVLNTAAGISILPELCFISNPKDLAAYQAVKAGIARRFAAILKYYDDIQ